MFAAVERLLQIHQIVRQRFVGAVGDGHDDGAVLLPRGDVECARADVVHDGVTQQVADGQVHQRFAGLDLHVACDIARGDEDVAEAVAISKLNPEILLAEPTELIGTGTVADDSYMVETIQKLHEANPDVLVMIASGVSTADDVYHILKLGADGTGATSGILNAPSPAGRIQEWADAVIKLQNEQREGKQYEII